MQAYDIALKLLLKNSAALTLRELTGTAIASGWMWNCPRFKICA